MIVIMENSFESTGVSKTEQIEKSEKIVDLSNLSVTFCSDDFVKKYYETKQSELSEKDKWIKDNQEYINESQGKIIKAIEDGEIPDGKPETIWKYNFDMLEDCKGKAIEIKTELSGRMEQIKNEVAKKLKEFLPDWKLEAAKITFTMNENADFCVDGNEITVDIGRLTLKKDAVDKVIEGISHEIFHIWMKEYENESNDKNDGIKKDVIFKVVDEGLAVLISGQSLPKHHENQGRSYIEYTVESFQAFREFLKQNNSDELEKYSAESFKNMGYSYVVGYEIARKVLQQVGVEEFRKIIKECRIDPEKMLDKYRKIQGSLPVTVKI